MVGADGGETAYYDLFVEVPFTGMILEFSSLACSLPPGYTIEGWDICAQQVRRDGFLRWAQDTQPKQGLARKGAGGFGSCDCDGCTDESICWRKTTVAAAASWVGLGFSIELLGAHWIRQGHPGINMQRCANIAWCSFDCGFQYHFVDGLSYPSGPMSLEDFAAYVAENRDLDGDIFDQWLDNHDTLWVDDLAPFMALYDEYKVPYLLRNWAQQGDEDLTALFVTIPKNGAAVSLLSRQGAAGREVQAWDLCAPSTTA